VEGLIPLGVGRKNDTDNRTHKDRDRTRKDRDQKDRSTYRVANFIDRI
jgi:hypothetical protein